MAGRSATGKRGDSAKKLQKGFLKLFVAPIFIATE
jgi:hypothetical protein